MQNSPERLKNCYKYVIAVNLLTAYPSALDTPKNKPDLTQEKCQSTDRVNSVSTELGSNRTNSKVRQLWDTI
jgi:hypothetical protein